MKGETLVEANSITFERQDCYLVDVFGQGQILHPCLWAQKPLGFRPQGPFLLIQPLGLAICFDSGLGTNVKTR